MKTLDAIRESLPDYARDLRLNLGSVLAPSGAPGLTERQIWAAAAVMGMNNIYYRFLHLVEDAEYKQMPARLRMNVLANPGIDKQDFELLSLAVSAINGCGTCVASHERQLRQHGMSGEGGQRAVRIAAT